MEISKISIEEQLLFKYYVIKHLTLLKIGKYVGYQRGFTPMFYKRFDYKILMEQVQ